MMRATFTTDDGIEISGIYSEGTSGRAVLLLHMMTATKESWGPLVATLGAHGFSTLAIDLRGHGESVRSADGRTLDFNSFTDEEQQAKRLDVAAAAKWLAVKGVTPSRLAVVGASIGANLAIDFAATHKDVPAAVALSPGLNYRGVTTEDAVSRMPSSQRLLLVASSDDPLPYEAAGKLAKRKSGAETRLLENAGHGTSMFGRSPTLPEVIATWIDARVH